MNRRQLIALSAIAIGIILMVFASHSMHKAEKAKSTIDHVTDFFTNGNNMWNPLITFFGGQARVEASKYDTTLSTLWIIGIALVIGGAASFFWRRGRRA